MPKETNSFDAIVIGSGVSGGWAAKELCEKGLKTLVLERGRMIEHGNYPTAMKDPWDLPLRGRLTQEDKEKYHVQVRAGFIDQANKHHFINDVENPYEEVQPFDWIRGDQVGGEIPDLGPAMLPFERPGF